MNLRLLMIFAAAPVLAGAEVFAAEPKETLETVDGSVYMGHTSVQDFGKGTFVFLYDSATVVRPRNEVELKRMESSLESLNDDWRNWFAVNPQYIRTDASGNKSVVLYRLNDGNVTANVFLYSRSPEKVKYHIKAASKLELADADVKRTIYGRLEPLYAGGIVTEITTVDGQIIRGELIEDSAEGKGILTDDLLIEIVPAVKIANLRRLPLDPDAGIETQVAQLDELRIAAPENERNLFKGVITRMNYFTNGKLDLYIILYDPEHPDMEGVKIPMSKLVSKSKCYNSFYNPRREAALYDDSSVSVNGVEVPEVVYANNKGKFKIETAVISIPEVQPVNDGIIVSYLASNGNEDPELVRVSMNDKGHEFKLDSGEFGVVTIPASERVMSRNSIVRASYTSLAPGTYALYNKQTGKIYLFTLVEGSVG